MLDKFFKDYWDDFEFRCELQYVKSLVEVFGQLFDCVYLVGGYGVMYDFFDDIVLQVIIEKYYESDKVVVVICYGVSGFLNVKLFGGEYFIKDKKIIGFFWFEESLVGRKKEVFFDFEVVFEKRGVDYEKVLILMILKVVVDCNLIMG